MVENRPRPCFVMRKHEVFRQDIGDQLQALDRPVAERNISRGVDQLLLRVGAHQNLHILALGGRELVGH